MFYGQVVSGLFSACAASLATSSRLICLTPGKAGWAFKKSATKSRTGLDAKSSTTFRSVWRAHGSFTCKCIWSGRSRSRPIHFFSISSVGGSWRSSCKALKTLWKSGLRGLLFRRSTLCPSAAFSVDQVGSSRTAAPN